MISVSLPTAQSPYQALSLESRLKKKLSNRYQAVRTQLRHLGDELEQRYKILAERHVQLVTKVSSAASPVWRGVEKLVAYVKVFFSTVREMADVNEGRWTSPVMKRVYDITQKTRIVVLGLFPFLLYTGVRDAVKLAKNIHRHKVKKIKDTSLALVKDMAQLATNVGQTLLAFESFKVVTEKVAKAAKLLVYVGVVLSSVSIAMTVRKIRERKRFEKGMQDSVAQNRFKEFIQDQDAKMLARCFMVEDGKSIQRVVKNAFASGDQEQIEKVRKVLKGRVTQLNRSSAISIVADVVSLLSVTAIVWFPPIAAIGHALAAGLGVYAMGSAVHEYATEKRFNQALGLCQKQKRINGKYIGDLNKGTFDGKGLFQYRNKDFYRGEWKGGLRHGQGIFHFRDGRRYEGGWKNGLFHGEGELRYSNGSILKVRFENGVPAGKGRYRDSKGISYQQVWNEGRVERLKRSNL